MAFYKIAFAIAALSLSATPVTAKIYAPPHPPAPPPEEPIAPPYPSPDPWKPAPGPGEPVADNGTADITICPNGYVYDEDLDTCFGD